MMDNEIFQISNFNYGHFDAGLGFSVGLLYLLHLDGSLGSERFLTRFLVDFSHQ